MLAAAVVFAAPACSDHEKPTPSEDLGLAEMLSPSDDEDPRVLSAYNDYGVWVRMEITDPRGIYITPLVTGDAGANWHDALEIEPAYVNSGLIYMQTLLGNTSKEFTNAFFPLEWWLVKSYGGSSWNYQFRVLGRSRYIMRWPNGTEGALPEITDPANHYYQDSVVTYNSWYYLAQSCAMHMEGGIKEFVSSGKAYDGGDGATALQKQYNSEVAAAKLLEPETLDDILPGETLKEARDRIRTAAVAVADAKYEVSLANFRAAGGFVTTAGASSFTNDFAGWTALLATESYANIKAQYLDNSLARKAKYDAIVTFFKSYNWDIQATGNKFRLEYDKYKATLP